MSDEPDYRIHHQRSILGGTEGQHGHEAFCMVSEAAPAGTTAYANDSGSMATIASCGRDAGFRVPGVLGSAARPLPDQRGISA